MVGYPVEEEVGEGGLDWGLLALAWHFPLEYLKFWFAFRIRGI